MSRRKIWPPRVYSHPSGRDRIRINGRDIYLGPSGSDEARRRYLEIIGGIQHQTRPIEQPTVADLVVRYLLDADRKPTEEGRQARFAVRPLLAALGSMRAVDVAPRHMRDVRDAMAAKWSASTVRINFNRARGVFRWGAAEGLIPAETYQRLRLIRQEIQPGAAVQPVPDADLWRTLPHLSPTLRGMVLVQLACGCRAGEVVRLRWADVDASQSIWRWTLAAHKNAWRGHTRTIYLAADAQAALDPFRCRPAQLPIFSPQLACAEAGHTFRRRDGRAPGTQYAVSTYDRAVGRACRRAGVDPWSPGRLRHSAATRFVADYGWEAARILLGHRHVQTTRIYAEDDTGKVLRALAG